MSDSNNQSSTSTTSTPPSGRRGSFASQALQDLWGNNKSRPPWSGLVDQSGSKSTATSNGTNTFPGSVSSAAAQASHRRMSMTALGMNGGGSNQSSPMNGFKRSDSVSSHNSGSIDESAVEDGDPLSQSSPTTPFARRMSFGARALRDVRTGSGTGGGGGNTADSSGYNWADSFRSRAERSSSIASTSGSPNFNHNRSKSIATMQPPPVQPQAPKPMVPDHVGERILKGDFYMD
ncbi:hypothetical protein KVT40_008665 [Elsinoe batatas]|uniref:Uncharacterized protein n=1 Tax=Elsinoe batatas TaxID=2601811 RepID=A0A8K0KTS0_9PEZI|nr:hypothetical protein KVT40_008665 [Elsinoe batatas]